MVIQKLLFSLELIQLQVSTSNESAVLVVNEQKVILWNYWHFHVDLKHVFRWMLQQKLCRKNRSELIHKIVYKILQIFCVRLGEKHNYAAYLPPYDFSPQLKQFLFQVSVYRGMQCKTSICKNDSSKHKQITIGDFHIFDTPCLHTLSTKIVPKYLVRNWRSLHS